MALQAQSNADGKKRPNDKGQVPIRAPGLMLDGRQMAVLVDLFKAHGGRKVEAALVQARGSEKPVFFARKVLEGKLKPDTGKDTRAGFGRGLYEVGARPVTCFEDE